MVSNDISSTLGRNTMTCEFSDTQLSVDRRGITERIVIGFVGVWRRSRCGMRMRWCWRKKKQVVVMDSMVEEELRRRKKNRQNRRKEREVKDYEVGLRRNGSREPDKRKEGTESVWAWRKRWGRRGKLVSRKCRLHCSVSDSGFCYASCVWSV